MAGSKNERRPPSAATAARSGHTKAMAIPEACVASDGEEEAAALDADGQGVWDHAFCVVCDCLIETEAQPRDEHELDEEEWAIAAMSSLRRHERYLPAARSRPRRPTTSRASTGNAATTTTDTRPERAPLFCSERCRQLDLQRSGQLGEFMNYVSRRTPPELRAFSLAEKYTQADSPPRTKAPMSMAAKSLSTSLLRAETRISTAALADAEAEAEAAKAATPPRLHALDASPDTRYSPPDMGDELFRRRMSWQRAPPTSTTDASMPSNLTRARAALDERVSPEPLVSHSPSTDAELLAGSPPRSVMLGSGTPLDTSFVKSHLSPLPTAAPVAQVAALSVSATSTSSPLSLLVDGAGHHAEPSVSMQTSRNEPCWKSATLAPAPAPASASLSTSAGSARPRTAAELLRRTQRPQNSSDGGSSSHASIRDTRRSSAAGASVDESPEAARRGRALLEPSPSRTSDAGSGSDMSVRSERRDVTRRSRDVRVLPPLLGPLPAPRDVDSPSSLSQRGSTSDLASLGRTRSHMLSTSLQASSPRRAGLGWSAFSHAQPLPRPLERATTPEVPTRNWSYERLPGMRMYPIMQLPSAPVHDTYSQYWPPSAPAAGATTPHSARSDASGRRKSLFYFDG